MTDLEFYDEYKVKDNWGEPMRTHHTLASAPWTHVRQLWNEVVVGADGNIICKMPTLSPSSIANMKLISVAPSMLKVLDEVRRHLRNHAAAGEILNEIDLVLLKAHGR